MPPNFVMAVGDGVLNFWPVVQPWQGQSRVVKAGFFQKQVSIDWRASLWVAAEKIPVPLAELNWNLAQQLLSITRLIVFALDAVMMFLVGPLLPALSWSTKAEKITVTALSGVNYVLLVV